MPDKMKYVTIPLHISAVLYVLIGIFFPMLFCLPFLFSRKGVDPAGAIILLVFGFFAFLLSIGIAVFAEIVVKSLKQGKYWAWIAAICLAAIYIPSAFCLLGIFMLVGLLDADVTKFCQSKKARQA